MANSSTKHNTRTRRNRKYGLVHPGKRRDHRARILIAVDQSGSVFNEDLEMFFGECGNLSKHISFDIINFDAKIDEESLYKWKRGEKHDPIRTRFGGTDFNAPTEYVNVNRANYDAVIILTDGQAPKPKPCLVRRAWVICPNNDLYFETNEMVIKLRNEKS
jgi:predicted metal-dependent peptidase